MRLASLWGCVWLAAGCAMMPSPAVDPYTARHEAIAALKRAVGYPDNPVVRAQAIEALQDVAPAEGSVWFREALADPHPGVRFAACVALGHVKDQGAAPLLRKRVEDTDASVQAGALFALHRLGDVSRSSRLADLLLRHEDVAVRANTALLLGKLGEPGSVKLLRRARHDKSPTVRLQATEAMAILGDKQAIRQLSVQVQEPRAPWQVTALMAVAESDMPNRVRLLQAGLASAQHFETQLAAARGLGQLGHRDGYDVALRALRFNRPKANRRNPHDTPGNQIMRIRVMAALALGAIGDERAIPDLHRLMTTTPDARVRVAAAAGLAEVVRRSSPSPPFATASH